MYSQLYFAIEYAVLCRDGQFVDIDVKLVGQYTGHFMQDTDIVNAADFDGGGEEQRFMYVPRSRENMITVAGLEFGGHRALAFVNVNVLVAVDISQHIVARDGVATFRNDEILNVFFVQNHCFFPIYGDRLFRGRFLFCF